MKGQLYLLLWPRLLPPCAALGLSNRLKEGQIRKGPCLWGQHESVSDGKGIRWAILPKCGCSSFSESTVSGLSPLAQS